MSGVLETVLPVFAVIAAGYLAVYFRHFSDQHIDALMKFTQGFAIPCLLFAALVRLDLAQVFQTGLLASFYIGSLVCFILGIFGARHLFSRRPGESVAVGFAALFSNSVLLGLPIMERAFGRDALEPNFAIVALHAPFCYLLGISAMEFSRKDGKSLTDTALAVLRAIISNPLTIGILLGFALNLAPIEPPAFLMSAIDMIARAALPAALFALGGVLVRYGVGSHLPEVGFICSLSLFLHPTIVYILGTMVFDLSHPFLRAAVLTAAMAPGINSYVFASMYQRGEDTAASTVLIATALSVLTIPIWLMIIG